MGQDPQTLVTARESHGNGTARYNLHEVADGALDGTQTTKMLGRSRLTLSHHFLGFITKPIDAVLSADSSEPIFDTLLDMRILDSSHTLNLMTWVVKIKSAFVTRV